MRNALNVFTMHSVDDARRRAYATLHEFMEASAGIDQLRSSGVNFVCQIRKISAAMHSRLDSHVFRRAFLKQYFMKEVESMTNGALKKARKHKKFKMLHANLALLKEKHINAILDEYFKMCKIVYRTISTIHYTWRLQHNLE